MSVCAKLQLSSWSRSGWIVCVGWGGGGEHVATMSNSNAFAELRWVLTISYPQYVQDEILRAEDVGKCDFPFCNGYHAASMG